ncbi:hypothetical protein D3C85_969380 [compost metagenome]
MNYLLTPARYFAYPVEKAADSHPASPQLCLTYQPFRSEEIIQPGCQLSWKSDTD